MEDEQTNATDTTGNQVTPKQEGDGESTQKPLEKDGEPLSDYDKALELVKRREEATKAEQTVLDRKEKLAANSMLGGTSGGRVEPKMVSEEDKKKAGAKEFFKGTQLEKDIEKL